MLRVTTMSLALTTLAVVDGKAMTFASDFSPYPGYTPGLNVSGTVSILASGADEEAQVVVWDLSGVDPRCGRGAGAGIPNGCGIHVHEGTSCDVPTGPHYYDKNSLDVDPWLKVTYVSDRHGKSRGSFALTTGFTVSDMVGRVFVVHELSSGRRVACSLLGSTPAVSTSDFGLYPGYTGSLRGVSGTVTVATPLGSTKQIVTWNLTGVDASCSLGAGDGIANGCGIHVHAGTTCAAPTGPHFYDNSLPSEDPWLPITYVADGAGASVGTVTVDTGLRLTSFQNRAFVVHEMSGVRATCGLLGDSGALLAPSFSAYPSFEGDLRVSGTVQLADTEVAGEQLVLWDLTGVDSLCSTYSGRLRIANGCGIHVHEGTSCAVPTGPHFYSKSLLSKDPWLEVVYTSDSRGRATGSVKVTTGLLLDQVVGRTFVVHRLKGGERIACGVLFPAPRLHTLPPFRRYPGFTGNLLVAGTASVSVAGQTTQMVTWDLTGVDVACTRGAGDGIPNGCGLHVHEGTSCDTATGPHLYNKTCLSADPWLDVTYVANGYGASVGSVIVDTGLPLSEMVGRAFVVHERDSGRRVSCALLKLRREGRCCWNGCGSSSYCNDYCSTSEEVCLKPQAEGGCNSSPHGARPTWCPASAAQAPAQASALRR